MRTDAVNQWLYSFDVYIVISNHFPQCILTYFTHQTVDFFRAIMISCAHMYGFKSKHVWGSFCTTCFESCRWLGKMYSNQGYALYTFCDRQNLQLVVKLYNWATPPEFSHISGKKCIQNATPMHNTYCLDLEKREERSCYSIISEAFQTAISSLHWLPAKWRQEKSVLLKYYEKEMVLFFGQQGLPSMLRHIIPRHSGLYPVVGPSVWC